MLLSAHFGLDEMVSSVTAIARKIDNRPSPEIIENLKKQCEGMEQIRSILRFPIKVNSGYRCAELNKMVGGAASSAHMRGFATDFTCAQFGTPFEIVKKLIEVGLKFDKLICEGSWVHVSFDPQMRGITLTAHFDDAGKATYTSGV